MFMEVGIYQDLGGFLICQQLITTQDVTPAQNCLTPGGLLIIGAHETLPSGIKRFKQRSPVVWIKTQSYDIQKYDQL